MLRRHGQQEAATGAGCDIDLNDCAMQVKQKSRQAMLKAGYVCSHGHELGKQTCVTL